MATGESDEHSTAFDAGHATSKRFQSLLAINLEAALTYASTMRHLVLDCRGRSVNGLPCLFHWSCNGAYIDEAVIVELFQIIKRGGGVTLEMALIENTRGYNAMTLGCTGAGAYKWVRQLLDERCLDRGWSTITSSGQLPLCRILEEGRPDKEISAFDDVATRIAMLTDDTAINYCQISNGASPFVLSVWHRFFATLKYLASRSAVDFHPEHKSHRMSSGLLLPNSSIHDAILMYPERYTRAAEILSNVFSSTRETQTTFLYQYFNECNLMVPPPLCNLIALYTTHSVTLSLNPLHMEIF